MPWRTPAPGQHDLPHGPTAALDTGEQLAACVREEDRNTRYFGDNVASAVFAMSVCPPQA